MKKRTVIALLAAAAGVTCAAILIQRRLAQAANAYDPADDEIQWDDEPEETAGEQATEDDFADEELSSKSSESEENGSVDSDEDDSQEDANASDTTISARLSDKRKEDGEKPRYLFVLKTPDGKQTIEVSQAQYEAYGIDDELRCRKEDGSYQII